DCVELSTAQVHKDSSDVKDLKEQNRDPEMLRLEAFRNHPLIKFGVTTMDKSAHDDMINSQNLMSTRSDLMRTIAEKEELLRSYRAMYPQVVCGRTPKSLTLKIYHGGCFTPIPSRSYVGGQVSSFNVDEIDEFYLHDLKDMVVKLGYGLADLMYYHFLIPRLGLDYSMHPLNVNADILEMEKYVKDYKIILVYVEHGSSIFVTPKKGVSIAVDNHLRKGPIEIDNSPDVNKNLTPMCHRNLTKE
ncbi:hypothetical protein Tco_0566705, partial [Tanacetum coccineum]